MPIHQADRTTSPAADRSPVKPFIGVLPFCHYLCEFTPREVSHGTWTIRHRDSDEQVYITARYRDLQSSELVWRVETTLCAGTAEFKSHLTAERFIATMLRRNAGRRHYGGEPQSRFSFREIWWSATSDVFKLNAGYSRISSAASRLTRLARLAVDAAPQITRLVGRVLAGPFIETHKLLNLSRTQSRSRR